MRTVYIYADDNGISWAEKGGNSTLTTNTGEWSSGVQFIQHPDSKKDVYVVQGQDQVSFTLDTSESKQALKSKMVELGSNGGKDIELRADLDGSASASTTRWHSGYVQRR